MLRLLTCGEASGAAAAAALELMAAVGADLTQFEVEGGGGELGEGDPLDAEEEEGQEGDRLQEDEYHVGAGQVQGQSGDLEASGGRAVKEEGEEGAVAEERGADGQDKVPCFVCDSAFVGGKDLLAHLALGHFRSSVLDDCGGGRSGGDRLRCRKCGEEYGEDVDGLLKHFGVFHAVAVKYVPKEHKEKVGFVDFCIFKRVRKNCPHVFSTPVWSFCKRCTRGTGTWSSTTRTKRASCSNSPVEKFPIPKKPGKTRWSTAGPTARGDPQGGPSRRESSVQDLVAFPRL